MGTRYTKGAVTDIILETERLRLRVHRPGDAELIAAHLNSETVMKELGGPKDRAGIDAMIARNRACQAEFGHSFGVIERRADDELIGLCGIRRVVSLRAPMPGGFEIGWRLRAEYVGQGYAREAASAALTHAFTVLGAPRVVAFTSNSNRPSWGLMERLGMTRRADLDFDDPDFPPHLNPTIVYCIESESWTA